MTSKRLEELDLEDVIDKLEPDLCDVQVLMQDNGFDFTEVDEEVIDYAINHEAFKNLEGYKSAVACIIIWMHGPYGKLDDVTIHLAKTKHDACELLAGYINDEVIHIDLDDDEDEDDDEEEE